MKILTVVSYYLPGEKSGGPVRSIANMVECLGGKNRFLILTKDRDIGDKSPYLSIEPSSWQDVNKALVWYMRPKETRLIGLWRLITQTEYDLIYLNSLFSVFTIRILVLRALGLFDKKPMIIAPRGELSPGALEIKNIKKRIYLLLSKMAGFYRGVVWHASTDHEAGDIRRVFPVASERFPMSAQPIRIAPDPFLAPGPSSKEMNNPPLRKEPGEMRIVFISRISRKKNLDYALRLLSNLQGNIHFDIYGPCEDERYWDECRSLINALPSSIQVEYRGIAQANDVRSLFSRYHLFLFPTRGENFGHVIPEALSSGCLVLLSDQTPGVALRKKEIGWDIALDDPSGFSNGSEFGICHGQYRICQAI